MYVGIISRRYAKALWIYAVENGTEDSVYQEAERLAKVFLEVPELKRALNNPVLSAENKLKLICEAMDGKYDSNESMQRFIGLVLKGRREKFLPFIMQSFIDLYRRQKNISVGRLTTAFPASEKVVLRMKEMIEDKTHGTVELRTRTDPKLEGGFVFEMNTYRLDASVTNQIRRMRQQFIERNRRIV